MEIFLGWFLDFFTAYKAMFFFFVALVGIFSFTFAFPTPVDYVTRMASTDENVGNKLVFCHFMVIYTSL